MNTNREALLNFANNHIDIGDECDVLKADCDIIEFILDNCEITIPQENRFFVKVNCANIQNHVFERRADNFRQEIPDNGLKCGEDALAHTGLYDFSHTTTCWTDVISLGIVGLKERILCYAQKNKSDAKKARFYFQLLRVYDASVRFIKRAAQQAILSQRHEMAQGLFNLAENAPSSLFEAMQITIVYYVLQHIAEGTNLRTLGRLDMLFYPFYIKENKNIAEGLIYDYLKEIDRLEAPSNIPFALCGSNINGDCTVNELSYALLEAYKTANTTNTKLHLLCGKTTPTDIIKSAFEGVRNGNNSIVFMSDTRVIESLEKMGVEHADAVRYHVVGCYECGGEGELTCSCNARVNLPKALELALNNGRDMITNQLIGLESNQCIDSFEALYREFEKQVVYLCKCAMKATDLYEAHYNKIHSSPILSGTYISALEKGGDVYCDYAAKYNNSSVNAVGLATAVDSLAAIRKLVYEDKTVTLDRLTEILKSNWEAEETLRLFIKNRFPKFGTADRKVDCLAKDIVDLLYNTVSGKPNAKGGIYRLGLFSINWRWEFGEKTAASANGRLCGETLSQNTSASFGADSLGATAHLLSLTAIDTSKTPNGTIVDIDLHSSAVRGENGLNSLVSTLKTYFELGGFAVHYNVLDTDTLIKAKLNPENYPNLQVRLCGWNVLFSTLSEKEKDEFIARSLDKG